MRKIDRKLVMALLPERKSTSHKGDFGHVFILSGSRGMAGSSMLCSSSCIKMGAGLVTLGLTASLTEIAARRLMPEIMTLPLPETAEGTFSIKGYEKIISFLETRKIDTLAIGPGVSTLKETGKLVKKLLLSVKLPVVLDADGINIVAEEPAILRESAAKIIITPHPGEFSRLIKKPVKLIETDRARLAEDFASKYGVICVLKGHRTVVTDGTETFLNTTGNPGMATAGSGDVLTGMIAGLIKQVPAPLDAAVLGVYLHGFAGDLASKEKTQMCLVASDIIDKLPEAVKKNRRKQRA